VFFPSYADAHLDIVAATPSARGGELNRPGFCWVCDRQSALFVNSWFIVPAVSVMGYAGPRLLFLICPPSEVLRCGLRVDLNALCDLAERLSGLFIMAYRFNSQGGILHNVTLPRSWFINLLLPGTGLGKDTSAFVMFASTIIELMQRINAQVQRYPAMTASDTGDQFIADGSRMTSLTGPLYIGRM